MKKTGRYISVGFPSLKDSFDFWQSYAVCLNSGCSVVFSE